LKNGDIPVAPLSAAEFGKLLAAETDKFRKLAEGMKLE
jgi:hypothetical protein